MPSEPLQDVVRKRGCPERRQFEAGRCEARAARRVRARSGVQYTCRQLDRRRCWLGLWHTVPIPTMQNELQDTQSNGFTMVVPRAFLPENVSELAVDSVWKQLTIGSTIFTPLSSGGLWLAVIIMPITELFRLLERRHAIIPTVKTTWSRPAFLRGVCEPSLHTNSHHSRKEALGSR